jgi:hypothetical protein
MLAIRNAYTDVFAKGTRTTIAASDEEGYDVFSRSYGDTTLYVGLNIADEAKSIEIPVAGEDGALYNNLYDGTLYAVAGGKITVTIPAANDGGTVVLAIVKNEAVHYVPVTDAAGFDEVVDAIAGLDSEDYLFVDLFGTTVVPQKVFEALKGKNIDVYFQIPVTYYTNGTQIRWKVNGKNITVIKGDIDFGVTFKTNNIPAASVKAVAGDKTSTQMSLAYSGDFGMIAQMYVDFGTELTGKYANLFYYNPTQKALSYVQNFQVDADGFAAFSFTHASDYLIVMNDAVMSTVTSGTTPEQNGTINVSTSTNTNTATVPDTAKADVVTAENVKTGDSFPIFPFVLLFIIGGALAGYGVYRKKKVA